MLDPRITKLNDEQIEVGGIIVSALAPGTRIIIKTKNNTYEITVIKDNLVWVKGGRYFPNFVQRYFLGSTWGGSCLMLHWIGYGMHLEFTNAPGRNVTTTAIRTAIIYGEGWSYDMGWSSNNEP